MTEIRGTHDARFETVRAAFAENVATGAELGASLVVDIDGEIVLDLWGGFRDQARTAVWDEHTITNVWSTTKTVTSLAALMLVDRGDLDLYAPVAKYWPEFAANGKDAIEVRHLLGHTSGVSAWEQPVVAEDVFDWERSTAMLAAQAPWWEPGTASGYHMLNFGHLIGELVRRVTGKSLKRFVAEEIAGPLGADFQIGALEQDWGRIAELVPPPPLDFDLEALGPDSIIVRSLTGPAMTAEVARTAAWRGADIGGANGHGNARSVARMLSAITLGGTVGGHRLLGQDTIEAIFAEQANGIDLALGIPLRWGIGYALPRPDLLPWIPEGKICFWGGWGGSMIIMDLERRLTISYVMNRMAPGIIGSDRSGTYVDAVYHALR
ncbi:serine hydrolase domain-containing protein [Crossiella cryophila]|uniref:CubicO group peptidase (Beta-lactamase class C family) n=1 Tax=Crossiella cryophila TaxID=43355 RepID=A0A7W7FUN8_9PSEU|nr:serine hydrolase domain-containing protein [Crossiella cryophila]MBB4677633.1 CubicO group peptidase (beta-lactamase class C family) [Crossiella cryophila]